MKILFISNIHGQAGTSSNMLAIALMNGILYRRKSILLQTQFTLNQLELSLLKAEQRIRMEEIPRGMNSLIKSILAGTGTREILENCCVTLKDQLIDFLPGPYYKSAEVYEEEIFATISGIMDLSKQCYEFVYVDSGLSNNRNSRKAIEEADLVVMNVCQNKRILDDLFLNLSIKNPNICYLVGNYDAKSQYNKKYLFHTYKKMNKENTFFIPYNTEYRDAVSDAMITSFFMRNMNCEEEDENYLFMEELKNAARKIFDISLQLMEEEEQALIPKLNKGRIGVIKTGEAILRKKLPGENLGGELGAT